MESIALSPGLQLHFTYNAIVVLLETCGEGPDVGQLCPGGVRKGFREVTQEPDLGGSGLCQVLKAYT